MDDFKYQQPHRYRVTNKQREEEKKRKSGSSGGIPDRWLDYIGVNSWVENTRFIAFKCPLKPEMQKHLPDERRFTLGDLIERLDDKGKELGLIIDLTNTERYYKPADIADAQIQYFKLMTPGHNQIPNETCYQQFVDSVRTFLEQNKTNDKLIGVHCTHGLNRTGYLVVRYMTEYMDFSPAEALEAFNRARGHSMEKYTEDLLVRNSLSAKAAAAATTTEALSNSASGDQIQWPTFYSSMEGMSLDERRRPKQQSRGQPTASFTSVPTDRRETDQLRPTSAASVGHGRISQQQSSTNGHSYRQTSVAPRILSSSYNEDERSMQLGPAYFGSGSNVGRGRPMTGDR